MAGRQPRVLPPGPRNGSNRLPTEQQDMVLLERCQGPQNSAMPKGIRINTDAVFLKCSLGPLGVHSSLLSSQEVSREPALQALPSSRGS